MKFVLAPDKFKDSLTGLEFCNAVKEGILNIIPDADILYSPLADGGDGTIEVANYYLNGDFIKVEVNNPFFQKISATYLYDSESKTAFIEMAEASGLKLLSLKERDCKNATTFGTGELIADAIDKGVKTIILGIGGSATNDCGIGMATALGYQFLDKNNNEVIPVGKNLSQIVYIDDTQIQSGLKDITFKIACDVTNPLYGENGAAYVYAKQKGVSKNDIKLLDKGLEDFSKILDSKFKIISQEIQGAGAAGGMGIAAKTFLKGELISGITMIKELAQFEKKIKNADWIITGEGKLDEQTLSGKTINGILKTAKTQNISVAAFCGSISLTKRSLIKLGVSYAASLMDEARSLKDAMKNSQKYLTNISIEFSKKIQKGIDKPKSG